MSDADSQDSSPDRSNSGRIADGGRRTDSDPRTGDDRGQRQPQTGQNQTGRHRGSPSRDSIVPEADFASYYGRPIVKPAPWERDIADYMFTGGIAAGSALLGTGADLTGRPVLRRVGRLGAAASLGASTFFLIKDLGKPSRFLNMLRVAKPTSPMSMGTWILSGHGALSGLASASEVVGMLPASWQRGPIGLVGRAGRPAGVLAALTAPPLASYTGVLLADTATPAWHSAYRELPSVFTASAAAASGGLGLVGTALTGPGCRCSRNGIGGCCIRRSANRSKAGLGAGRTGAGRTGRGRTVAGAGASSPWWGAEAAPARAFAIGGALVELVMEHRMEQSMGLPAETLHQGSAGRWMKAAKAFTAAGAAGALLGRRSRVLSVASGAALMAGSYCTRRGVFEAGIASAKDPKYTVVPQRERVDRGEPVRYQG